MPYHTVCACTPLACLSSAYLLGVFVRRRGVGCVTVSVTPGAALQNRRSIRVCVCIITAEAYDEATHGRRRKATQIETHAHARPHTLTLHLHHQLDPGRRWASADTREESQSSSNLRCDQTPISHSNAAACSCGVPRVGSPKHSFA
jgi:hypothetical protein